MAYLYGDKQIDCNWYFNLFEGKSKSDENADPKKKQDVEVLLLQIEALQSQMAEQTRVSKEQVSIETGSGIFYSAALI